jgi:hypothetical protein
MTPIRIQPDTYRKIKELAAANGRTIQAQVNIMLREWFAANKAQASEDDKQETP